MEQNCSLEWQCTGWTGSYNLPVRWLLFSVMNSLPPSWHSEVEPLFISYICRPSPDTARILIWYRLRRDYKTNQCTDWGSPWLPAWPGYEQKRYNNTMIVSYGIGNPACNSPAIENRDKLFWTLQWTRTCQGAIWDGKQLVSGKCEITTYSLNELLGTKLRALYQRKKGRDLFDYMSHYQRRLLMSMKSCVVITVIWRLPCCNHLHTNSLSTIWRKRCQIRIS